MTGDPRTEPPEPERQGASGGSANGSRKPNPTEVRLRLFERGYPPVSLQGKIPQGKGWQTKFETNAAEIRLCETVYPFATNTGVLTRDTPFLDIDILNPEAAEAVEQLVKGRFDGQYILTRFGKVSKRAIPFQTITPFAKISVPLIAPDGSEERIEFLCDGQQCVVHGIHPDTQRPYSWHGVALWDVERDNLPGITAEEAHRLVNDIVELLVRAHGYRRKDAQRGGGNTHSHIWRSKDFDCPCTPTGVEWPDADGHIYAQVRSPDGALPNVPKDELVLVQAGNGAAGGWPGMDDLIEHDDLTPFAMKLLKSGMSDGAAVNMMRKLVSSLPNVDEDRRQRRLFEIPAMVSSARAKLDNAEGDDIRQGPDGLLRDAGRFEGPRQDSSGTLWWHGEANPDLNRNWIVEGLLPETGTALISGQWGVYKTFIALDLSLSLMTGTPFAGRRVNRRCGVLFVATEGAFEIPLRLQSALEAKFPEIKAQLPFALARECPRLLDQSALPKLEALAREAADRMREKHSVDLGAIIIDTMAEAALFKDESDNAEALRAMVVLDRLAHKLGCIVIAVDHFGKSIETGTRGASAKETKADAVLAVLGDREVSGKVLNPRTVVRKVRGAATGGEIPLTTRVVGPNEDGQTTLVIDWGAERGSAAPPKEFWPAAKRVFRDALLEALDCGVHRPAFGTGPTVRAVDRETVRKEFARRYAAEGDDDRKRQANLRQTFKRSLEYAQTQKLIGVEVEGKTTWIWLIKAAEAEA